MRGRTLTLRTVALLGAGSAAIHQLRYAIGYGDGASRALAAHPHGYLEAILPGIATAVAIAMAALLMRIAGGAQSAGRTPALRSSLLRLWLACAVALAAIYGLQETLEGAGAVVGGGWIGFALAAPAGFLVALAIRGADTAESMAFRGLPLRFVVLGARRIIAPTVSRRGRVASARIRSRGPPFPSVV